MTFFCFQVTRLLRGKAQEVGQLALPSPSALRPFGWELLAFCCSGIFLKTAFFRKELKMKQSSEKADGAEAVMRSSSLCILTAIELGDRSQVLRGGVSVQTRTGVTAMRRTESKKLLQDPQPL